MAPEIQGALCVSAALTAVVTAAELWHLRGGRPEHTRKLVHLGGGLACLLFPFLVRSTAVVVVMALALSALFAVTGKAHILRSMHGVSRESKGSELYPLAIAAVYAAAGGTPWLFVSSVLVLALADAGAALVGGRYGSLRYEVELGSKSVEGSLIFFFLAFLAIHLPTLLMTDLPRAQCVLTAALVALLVTAVEAISLGGYDNLFVPLCVCIALEKLTTKSLHEVSYQIVSFVCLFALILAISRRVRSFNTGGALTTVLFAYACWALGSEYWAMPVLAGFLLYVACWKRLPMPPDIVPSLRVRVVTKALAVPFAVLMAANLTERYDPAYPPFLASFAAVIALSIWRHHVMCCLPEDRRTPLHAALSAATASLAVTILPWVLQPHRTLAQLTLPCAACIIPCAAAQAIRGPGGSASRPFWDRIALGVIAGAALLSLTSLVVPGSGWVNTESSDPRVVGR